MKIEFDRPLDQKACTLYGVARIAVIRPTEARHRSTTNIFKFIIELRRYISGGRSTTHKRMTSLSLRLNRDSEATA